MEVIDGDGLVLGRLASYVAVRLKEGEEVHVVNVEKIIISGTPENVLERYKIRKNIRGRRGKGPFYPRRPDQIMKRTVRGMLPFKTPRGRKQHKLFKAHVGVPKEFQKSKFVEVETARNLNLVMYIELGELSRSMGASF